MLHLPLALACETRCASADRIIRWPPRFQRGAVAWRGAAAQDGPRPAQVSNGEVYYKAVSFYLEEHPDLLVDLLKVRGRRARRGQHGGSTVWARAAVRLWGGALRGLPLSAAGSGAGHAGPCALRRAARPPHQGRAAGPALLHDTLCA